MLRESEQRAAATILGIERMTFLDFSDGELAWEGPVLAEAASRSRARRATAYRMVPDWSPPAITSAHSPAAAVVSSHSVVVQAADDREMFDSTLAVLLCSLTVRYILQTRSLFRHCCRGAAISPTLSGSYTLRRLSQAERG